MKLLADTSALLALAVRDDQHQPRAVAFVRSHPHARFVVTELILAEVVTRLRARADAARAAAVARSLAESRRYDLVFTDADLLHASIGKMERFADKRLSLTDCVSFEIMDRLGLHAAFTFDHDFRDCGYAMLP